MSTATSPENEVLDDDSLEFTQEQLDRATRRLVRLSKLGTETDEQGNPTHEAQRAQEQLAELTAKYRISEAVISARLIEEGTFKVNCVQIDLSPGHPDFQLMLFNSIAEVYGLRVVHQSWSMGRGRARKIQLNIFGSENTAILVTQLYSEMLPEVFSGMYKYLEWRRERAAGYLTKSQTKSIQVGYAAGFAGIYVQRVRDLTEDNSKALDLVRAEIGKAVEEAFPNAKVSRVRIDGHAQKEGQRDAEDAPISTDRSIRT